MTEIRISACRHGLDAGGFEGEVAGGDGLAESQEARLVRIPGQHPGDGPDRAGGEKLVWDWTPSADRAEGRCASGLARWRVASALAAPGGESGQVIGRYQCFRLAGLRIEQQDDGLMLPRPFAPLPGQ